MKYKPKKVGIETTGGIGHIYLEQLYRECPNLNFQSISTNGDSKPSMISNLLLALERRAFIYPTNTAIVEELLSFRRDGKKLEAPSGKHDDIIMGVSFALVISPFNDERVGFKLTGLEKF